MAKRPELINIKRLNFTGLQNFTVHLQKDYAKLKQERDSAEKHRKKATSQALKLQREVNRLKATLEKEKSKASEQAKAKKTIQFNMQDALSAKNIEMHRMRLDIKQRDKLIAELQNKVSRKARERPKVPFDAMLDEFRNDLQKTNRKAGSDFMIDDVEVEIRGGLDMAQKKVRVAQLDGDELGPETASRLRIRMRPRTRMRVVDDDDDEA